MITNNITINNPYYDEIGILLEQYHSLIKSREWDKTIQLSNIIWSLREKLIEKYSYAIPSPNILETIKQNVKLDEKIIKIGAGTGYWGWILHQMVFNIECYDIEPYKNYWCNGNYYLVKEESSDILKERKNCNVLLLSWPSDNYLVEECLNKFKGNKIVYIGEQNGCTGFDDRLLNEWRRLISCPMLQYPTIRDYLLIFERL